jgi:hypothetical protein
VTDVTLELQVHPERMTRDRSAHLLLGQFALPARHVDHELHGVVAISRSYVRSNAVPPQSSSGRQAVVAIGQQESTVDGEDGDRWGFVEVVQVVGHAVGIQMRPALADRFLYQAGDRNLRHGHDRIVPREPPFRPVRRCP